MDRTDYISTKEAASRLGVTQAGVRYMCRTGAITCKKNGKSTVSDWRILSDSIRQCKWCGKWFAVNSHKKAYCSAECKADAKRQRDRDYRRRLAEAEKNSLSIAGDAENEGTQMCMEDLLAVTLPATSQFDAKDSLLRERLDEAADALLILAKAIRHIMEELEK